MPPSAPWPEWERDGETGATLGRPAGGRATAQPRGEAGHQGESNPRSDAAHAAIPVVERGAIERDLAVVLGQAWTAVAHLQDRFGPVCNTGDQHGFTAQLSAGQIDDLIAYLESL